VAKLIKPPMRKWNKKGKMPCWWNYNDCGEKKGKNFWQKTAALLSLPSLKKE
jgi:hypothetical protein